MGKWQFGTLAVAALALAGCNRGAGTDAGAQAQASGTPSAEASLVKGIYTLPACDSDPTANTLGTVNIVLKGGYDGGEIQRHVYKGPKVDKNDPNTGEGGLGGFSPNAPNKTGPGGPPPYDVFLDSGAWPDHYVLVRVLLQNGNRFAFDEDDTSKFYGVGRNDPNDGTLCGAAKVIPIGGSKSNQAHSAATFYVDMAKLAARGTKDPVPFTIALLANKSPPEIPLITTTTPILIDPAIIDNGGGGLGGKAGGG
jgi:hypothetical protein